MQYQWAFPVGHQSPTQAVQAGRRYYQPVPGRDDSQYCSGYELRVAAANAALYALADGTATYTHDGTTGTLKLALDAGLSGQLFSGEIVFLGVRPKIVLYENMDHAGGTLRTALSQLIDGELARPAAQRAAYSPLNTVVRAATTGPGKTPALTLLAQLGPGGTTAYDTAKNAFLDAVLDQQLPFKLAAGHACGGAGPDPAPGGDKMLRLLTKDVDDQYFNPALLLDVLLRGSVGTPAPLYKCLTVAPAPGLFVLPLPQALGLTPGRGQQNAQPPATLSATLGRRDVVLHKSLFTWHSGPPSAPNDQARLEWRLNPTPNGAGKFKLLFEVRRKTPGVPLTAKVPPGKGTNGSNHLDYTISLTDTYPKKPPPLVLLGQANLARQQHMKTIVTDFYAANKAQVDAIGYYLGVPAEVLLAIAGHESGGSTGYVVFESMESSNDTELRAEMAALKATNPALAGFADQYKQLHAHTPYRVDASDLLGMSASAVRAKPVFAELPAITWGLLFDALDKAKPAFYLETGPVLLQRISVGLTQTLLSTARNVLPRLQAFVGEQYGPDAPAVQAALHLNYPDTPSALLLWLLQPQNSLLAGAAKMLLNSGNSLWDLPIAASYYNAGGQPSIEYNDKKKPNPWGYFLNDEQYCLNMMASYNALRELSYDNPNKFTTRLHRDIS